MTFKKIVMFLFLSCSLFSLIAADLRVNVIDVGQGDAICIQTPGGKIILVDAGDTSASSKVVNFLKSKGCKDIQLMVLTHPHADHYGGMESVINNYSVAKYWDNDFFKSSNSSFNKLKSLITDKKIDTENVVAGKSQIIDNVVVSVLGPVVTDSANPNNDSVIIRLSYGTRSFLLMGDAENEERNSINKWQSCDVLKVSHHGSSNGTDSRFISQVRPLAAVISYGINNTYGHPAVSTLSALGKISIAKTAIDGSITYSTDGKSLSIYKMGVTTTPDVISNPDGTDIMVYVTKSGACYHKKSCRYSKSGYPVTLKDAVERNLKPCKICKP